MIREIGNFIKFFTIAFILFCIYIYYSNYHSELVHVKSNVDDELYLVRNLKDKQQAADMLATLSAKLTKMVDIVQEEKAKEDTHCTRSIDILKRRFRKDRISESPADADYTSYSVNKGEKIFFCIRAKDEGMQLVDENTLTFVALHELAHVMTRSVGHTKEFWNNFKYLLRHAIKNGVYSYQKFSENPKKYCGMTITDTPYTPGKDDEKPEKNETKSCY